MPSYGYLAMERVRRWVLDLPDEPEVFDSEEAARQAERKWREDHDLPKVIEEWEQAREEFHEQSEVIRAKVGSGLVARKQQQVVLPNGHQLSAEERDPKEVIEDAWLAQSPFPTMSSLSASSLTTKAVVIWTGELFLDDERKQLPAAYSWSYGLPMEPILKTLNELASQGWTIVQASEDRGLFQGTTVGSDAYVTRIRYLLARL